MSAGGEFGPIEPHERRFPWGALVTGMVIGFLLFLAAGSVARAVNPFGSAGLLSRLAAYVTGRSTSIDVTSPAVVDKIRQLSRLETVVYSLDKIVSGSRENAYIPDFLVGDKLLLVAHGEVIAGVDLSQIQPGDVSVRGIGLRCGCPRRKCLRHGSITGARGFIPAPPAFWFRPTRIWNRRFAWPPSSRSRKLH